jgi:hypothetical protein
MAFDDNVFVNCPFDEDYHLLLRPLLFTIIYAGMTPRIASERLDSGEPRITKIAGLVSESMYAIHDISRIKARKRGELFRLNMPFELGLDIGCRLFAGDHRSRKKCLILEAERYRYQAAISDLSGSDIAVHSGDPAELVAQVRNWLYSEAGLDLPGPSRIWNAFTDFMAASHDALEAKGFSKQDIRRDIKRRPMGELMKDMRSWIVANRNASGGDEGNDEG